MAVEMGFKTLEVQILFIFIFLKKNLKNPDFRLSQSRKLLPFSLIRGVCTGLGNNGRGKNGLGINGLGKNGRGRNGRRKQRSRKKNGRRKKRSR